MVNWQLILRDGNSKSNTILPINPHELDFQLRLTLNYNGIWALSHGVSRTRDERTFLCELSSNGGFVQAEVFVEGAMAQQHQDRAPDFDNISSSTGLPLRKSSEARQVLLLIRPGDVLAFPEQKVSVTLNGPSLADFEPLPEPQQDPLNGKQHVEVKSSGADVAADSEDEADDLDLLDNGKGSPASTTHVYSTAQTAVVHETPVVSRTRDTTPGQAQDTSASLETPTKANGPQHPALAPVGSVLQESRDLGNSSIHKHDNGEFKADGDDYAMPSKKNVKVYGRTVTRTILKPSAIESPAANRTTRDGQREPDPQIVKGSRKRKSADAEDLVANGASTPDTGTKRTRKPATPAMAPDATRTPRADCTVETPDVHLTDIHKHGKRSSAKGISIMFSGSTLPNSPTVTRFLKSHGVVLATQISDDPTVLLVTGDGEFKTSAKNLNALVVGQKIIDHEWIMSSREKGHLVDPKDFVVQGNHNTATKHKSRTNLFRGKTIVFTPAAKKAYQAAFDDMLAILDAAGAQTEIHTARSIPDDTNAILIGLEDNDNDARSLLQRKLTVYKKNLLSDSILEAVLLTDDDHKLASLSKKKARKS